MKNRVIVFMLIAAVVFSMLSGCTAAGGTNISGDSSSSAATGSTEAGGDSSSNTGAGGSDTGSDRPSTVYRALLVSASEDDPKLGLSTKHDIVTFEHVLRNLKTPEGSDILEITRMHDVKDESELEEGIKKAFFGASDDDVNIFFFSGHGVSLSGFGDTHIGLGYENPIRYSAEQLYEVLSQIPGKHLVIIAACMSGGFKDVLVGERFFVITASSALQLTNSYGQGENYESDSHSFMVIGLCEGLGLKLSIQGAPWSYDSPPLGRVAADNNNDGVVTFKELRQYLRYHWQISSIIQTYPENCDLPLFSYDDPKRSPAIYDISLSWSSTSAFTIEFTVNETIDGLYAEAHWPDARKQETWGFRMSTEQLDIVLLGNGRYRIEWDGIGKGVVDQYSVMLQVRQSPFEALLWYNIFFSEPAAAPEITLLDSDFQPDVISPYGQEYRIVVSHNFDCLFDVGIYNGSTLVRTLVKGDAAQRITLSNWGYENSLYNVYYWDGRDDTGEFVPEGDGYEVRVGAYNIFGEVVQTKTLPQVMGN